MNVVPIAISQNFHNTDRETGNEQQCSRMGCKDAAKHKQTQELGAVHSCYASTLHTALKAPSSTHQQQPRFSVLI